MNIYDWFDVDNKEHIIAFVELTNKGMWPKGFIPEEIQFPPGWQILLFSKLGVRWVKFFMEEKKDG